MDVPALRSDPVARHRLEQVQRGWRSGARPTRHIDPIIPMTATALALLGLLAIYSAKYASLTSQELPTDFYVARQAIALGIGLVGRGSGVAVAVSAGALGSVVSSGVRDGVGVGEGAVFLATVMVIVEPWLTEDPAGADCSSTVPVSASSVSRISTAALSRTSSARSARSASARLRPTTSGTVTLPVDT